MGRILEGTAKPPIWDMDKSLVDPRWRLTWPWSAIYMMRESSPTGFFNSPDIVRDASPHQRHITDTSNDFGTFIGDSLGQFGDGLQLDGNSNNAVWMQRDLAGIPFVGQAGTVLIIAKINTVEGSPNMCSLDRGTGGADEGVLFQYNSGSTQMEWIGLDTGGSDSWRIAATSIDAAEVHVFAGTFDADIAAFAADGVLVGSATPSGTLAAYHDRMAIGRPFFGFSNNDGDFSLALLAISPLRLSTGLLVELSAPDNVYSPFRRKRRTVGLAPAAAAAGRVPRPVVINRAPMRASLF